MDTTGGFPRGFEHLAEIVQQAEDELTRLDELIENSSTDRGPRPGYNPPGSIGDEPPTTRDQKIVKLKKQQEQVRSTTFATIERELKNVDPETARVVRDNGLERIYPNRYLQMNAMDKKAHESEKKDIFASQDFVAGQIAEGKLKEGKKDIRQDSEQAKIGPITKSVMESLSYNKSFKEVDAEKLQEKDGIIGRKEPTATMSSSFIQHFSYIEAQMDTNNKVDNSPDKERDDPEPEI